jgi:outer membrane protein TolC
LSMMFLTVSPALARVQRLEPLLVDLLKNSKKIHGMQTDFAAQKDRLNMEKGKQLPILDVTANRGFEKIDGVGTSSDSDLDFNEVGLKLTQTVWDFGATNSDIRKGQQGVERQSLLLKQQMENSLVEGITVFLEVKRAAIVRNFAKRSESNIKRQAELSEVMLAEGAGLSSDIIEVRKQLATAQTKLFNAELAMVTQVNKFKKIFATSPVDFDTFEDLDFAILSHIPKSVYEVISRVDNNNQDLKLAGVDIADAKEDSVALKSRSFFPKIDAIFEKKWKQNVGGTVGYKTEMLGKLELTLPISLGFTEAKEYMASVKDKDSLIITLEALREDMVEEARNGWHKLIVSTMVWSSIKQQADLAAESLEIAYSESSLGIGSKIKVLNSETALLTAQSDANSARIDILLDALSLLNLMGDISIGILIKKEPYEDLVPAPLPIFHSNFSIEPSAKVVAALKKIVNNAKEKPEPADTSTLKDKTVQIAAKKVDAKIAVKPEGKPEKNIDIVSKPEPEEIKVESVVKPKAEENEVSKPEIDVEWEIDNLIQDSEEDKYNPDTMLSDEELEIQRLYSVPATESPDDDILPKKQLPDEILQDNKSKKVDSLRPTYDINVEDGDKPQYDQPPDVKDEEGGENNLPPTYDVGPNDSPSYAIDP